MIRIITIGIIGLMLQACAWVELTPEGEKTRLLSAAEVKNCEKRGKTTVSVKGDVAGLDRDREEVQKELNTLARNSAPDLEGDTVVPVGQPENGRQVFDVYRCVKP